MNRILLITQDNIGTTGAEDELARCVISSYNLRRGTPQTDKTVSDEIVDDKAFKVNLNFSARKNLFCVSNKHTLIWNFFIILGQKKRRKSVYVTDDDKKVKDQSLRRRTPTLQRTPGAPPTDDDGDDSTVL
jgi:hypothetical protein